MTTTIVGLPVAYIVDSTGKFVDLQLANGDPARLATFVGGVLVAGGVAVPGGGGSTPLVNDLISGGATSALTAQQGVVLKGLVDTNTTAIGTKQATLLSGTSIRTVNGNTLLGGADLVISGGVPNQTGTLAASATAAPVADTVIAALATKATVGVVTYVDVTASRALLATDIGKVLRNTTAGSLTITLAASIGVVGNVFATKHSGAGTLLVATGGGITAVDAGGLAAAQTTDGGAVLWEFDSATRVLAS